MKMLQTNILFQLPDDFEGDDLNEALEEFIKYRRNKNSNSLKEAHETTSDVSEDISMYDSFMNMIRSDGDDKDKTLHASGIYKLSDDGKEWIDN